LPQAVDYSWRISPPHSNDLTADRIIASRDGPTPEPLSRGD